MANAAVANVTAGQLPGRDSTPQCTHATSHARAHDLVQSASRMTQGLGRNARARPRARADRINGDDTTVADEHPVDPRAGVVEHHVCHDLADTLAYLGLDSSAWRSCARVNGAWHGYTAPRRGDEQPGHYARRHDAWLRALAPPRPPLASTL